MGNIGLGNENAFALVWSTFTDFGAGVLLYNNTTDLPGIAWEGGWYWTTP